MMVAMASRCPCDSNSSLGVASLLQVLYIKWPMPVNQLVTINPERNKYSLSGIRTRVHPRFLRLACMRYRCRHQYAA